ncbi:hypothetical protein [Luteitalea sp.]
MRRLRPDDADADAVFHGVRRGRPFELLEKRGDASTFEVETGQFSAQASAREILEVEFP